MILSRKKGNRLVPHTNTRVKGKSKLSFNTLHKKVFMTIYGPGSSFDPLPPLDPYDKEADSNDLPSERFKIEEAPGAANIACKEGMLTESTHKEMLAQQLLARRIFFPDSVFLFLSRLIHTIADEPLTGLANFFDKRTFDQLINRCLDISLRQLPIEAALAFSDQSQLNEQICEIALDIARELGTSESYFGESIAQAIGNKLLGFSMDAIKQACLKQAPQTRKSDLEKAIAATTIKGAFIGHAALNIVEKLLEKTGVSPEETRFLKHLAAGCFESSGAQMVTSEESFKQLVTTPLALTSVFAH